MYRKGVKIALVFLLLIIILLVVAVLLLRIPKVQTYLTKQSLNYVENWLGTEVSASDIKVDIFNNVQFSDFLVRDEQNDTLIYAKKLNVDINELALLRKKISINNIDLIAPYINIYPVNDSTFNYQFIVDEFNGQPQENNKQEAESSKVGQKQAFTFDLGDLFVNNARFNFEDFGSKTIVQTEIKQLNVSVDKLDISNHLVFSNIELTEPNVLLWLSGESSGEEKDTVKTLFPSLPLMLDAKNVKLNNGQIEMVQGNPEFVNSGFIDWESLFVNNINIELNNVTWENDTLSSNIKQLALKEVSGFEVNKFVGDFEMNSQKMSLTNLNAKTKYSSVSNAFSLEYDSLDDFSDFLDKVYLNGQFENTIIDWRDLEYFVPAFSKVEMAERFKSIQQLKLNGSVKGTVDNLKGKKIELAHGNTFYFKGDFKLKGLPNINDTFIDFDVVKLKTNIDAVASIFPEVKLPDNVYKLGKLEFEGEFLGFINDFVAEGNLDTDIGSAFTDINMKIKGVDNATYSGDLQITDFELGAFLDQQEKVGNVSLNMHINGTGLTFESAKANLDGKIESLWLNGLEYKDVAINGRLDEKLFNGKVNISQDEVNFDFEGGVNLADLENPVFNFKSNIIRLNLKEMGLISEPYILSLKSDLDMSGNDIDNFRGTANFKDITIEKDGEIFPIATASVSSSINQSTRKLSITSNIVDANFEGDFGFKNLPNSFKKFFSSYFPYNIQYNDSIATQNLNIDFDIKIKEATSLTKLFIPQLTKVDEGWINGKFNSLDKTLNIDGFLPNIVYDNIVIDSVAIRASSDEEAILLSSTVSNIDINNFDVPFLNISSRIAQDSIDCHLTVNKGAKNGMDLHGIANVNNNQLYVWVDSLVVNVAGLPWEMKDENLRFKNVSDYELMDWTLAYKNQYLNLSSFPNEENTTTLAYLKGINLGEFAELADLKELNADGLLDGNIEIIDVFNTPLISGNLNVAKAQIFGEKLGKIIIKADKAPSEKRIDITANVKGDDYNVEAEGYYDLSLKPEEALYISAFVKKFSLSFLQGILQGEIKETGGYAEGEIVVNGPITAPKLSGELLTHNGVTTIDFLNVRYRIADRLISLDENNIYFDELLLFDKFNNVAELNGLLKLNDFNNIEVEVSAITDEFLLLDTPRAEEQVFYGSAIGSGFIVFEGPVNDIYMYFNVTAKEGTDIALPLTDEYDVSGNEVFSFIQKEEGKDDNIDEEEGATNFQIDMDFELTPDAQIQLIFDYQAGDIIRANGDGNIQIGYNSKTDDFAIYGNYDITQGSYLFTLQNVVNKRFEIEPGSRIDFFGDPYKANVDIETTYRFKTSLYELVQNDDTEDLLGSDELKKRVPVELKLNLTGELGAPDIDFKIELPDEALTSFNSSARIKLDEINNDADKNELNRQVFGLLVFNKFLPSNSSLFGNEYITSSVSTTMSEFLSNQFSNLLSQTISEIIPDSELSVNWRNYTSEGVVDPTDPEAAALYNRNEIELTYRQKLFNDRVIIDIGGNFDVGERYGDDYDNVALAGDFVVQYKITPDGFYRLKLFAKTDSDIFTGRYNKTGVSISVTEDFDNFKDLVEIFKARKEARKSKRAQKKSDR